jgi:chemotaxis signal transduction protein
MKDVSDEAVILRARAERLARQTAKDGRGDVVERLLVVSVGAQRFGLPMGALREVAPTPPIQPLPRLAQAVLGLAQLRGELFVVIDLGAATDAPASDGATLVLCTTQRGSVGLRVDAIHEVRDLYAKDRAQGTRTTDGDGPIAWVTQDLVGVLDVNRLKQRCGLEAAPEGA